MSSVDQPKSALQSRRDLVFFVLAGIFVTHALLGELLGGKLFMAWGWVMSIGVIPWPVVFVTTDLVNEYYGPRAVRRLTWLAVVLIIYMFGVLYVCMLVPAWSESPVDDASFNKVFGQSMWIIVGSIVAFVLSQLLDAAIFASLRKRTQGVWVRALTSTAISQLIDTFVINSIAFGLPGKLDGGQVFELSVTNYGYKFLIALATLPLIYVGHAMMDRYVSGERSAQDDGRGDRFKDGLSSAD